MNRRFRLKRSADFKRVWRFGSSYAHPFLVLKVSPNQEEQTRIGVSAGKAVGNAVARNRAKRLMRAAISPLLPQLPAGYDLVLIARKAILEVKSQDVQKALTDQLKKAHLLSDDHKH